ncbi:MAG: hypothetical protein ACK4FB_09050 [Brevundimonas sp.]|uniref:hypothetical protein n=1 Tax=Brevundimonas sp. TaxID=1871086 RepID=UPI00391AA970
MARRRLPFGTTAQLAPHVLFEGEVVTDVTDFRFRIGDGVTAGGVPQARLSEVLARTLRDGSNLTQPASWRQALELGTAAGRNVGTAPGQVAPGDLVATLQTTVTNLGLNMGTSKLVDTVAQLAAIPGAALYDQAIVQNDPLGNVENGNGKWSFVGPGAGDWVWRGPLSEVLWDDEDEAVKAPGLWLGREDRDGGLQVRDGVGSEARPGAAVELGWTSGPSLEISDGVGSSVRIGLGGGGAASQQEGFTEADRAWVAARARAKAEAMKNTDLSALAGYLAGANLRLCLGQSFRAGSDNARLYASASQIALMGWDYNAWQVGDASRCVGATAVYDLYGTAELNPLVETFVRGPDLLNDAQIAAGQYPLNARGGTPEVITAYVFEVLRARALGQAAKDISRYSVSMNVAKSEGSLAEISDPATGGARTLDAMNLFKSTVEDLDGAAPSTVGAGNVDPLNCMSINFDHGQADEGLNQDYITPFSTWMNSLFAHMQTAWGQSARPAIIMSQAGGPRYGGAAMFGRAQYATMLQDKGPASNFNHIWISHVDYGLPNFYYVAEETGHVNWGDGHLTQAGNVMKAVWHAAAEYYLIHLRRAFYPPFVHEVFYRGRHWLAGVAVCFPPLRESQVVVSTDPVWLANKGISFETDGGIETATTTVGMAPGWDNVIEGTCADPIEGFRNFKAAKGGVGHPSQGCTNFRDSFSFDSPLPIKFETPNQIRYANADYATNPTADGWLDNPATNGTSPPRYLENIEFLVGTRDWGLFMLGDLLIAKPMPDITA